jgi:hypothetical protein
MAGRYEQERRQARIQVTALGLMVSAVFGAAIWAKHAPADAAGLRILVGELRSQAAELETIEEERGAGRLDDSFVREHARQLAKANTNSFHELARLRVEREIEAEKGDALQDARELTAQIAALAAGQPVAPPSELKSMFERLRNRESALGT